MYVCQICQKTVLPRTPANRIITETRARHYPRRSNANPVSRKRKSGRTNDPRKDDPGGVGYEIVREIIVCPVCAQREQ
jgi:hypothetical protein